MFLAHLIEAGVRTNEDICRKRAHHAKALDKVLADVRIAGIVSEIGRIQTQAADDNDIVSFSILRRLERPSRASLRVAWREMRRQSRSAERDRIAIMEHPIDGMRLAARPHVVQCRNVLFHGHDRGAGELLHERVSGHVIGMRVTPEQDFDVGELETEFLDRGADDRNSLFVIAINKDVAFRRRNQERAQLFGSDKVHAADNLVRRKRLVPVDSRESVASSTALSRLSGYRAYSNHQQHEHQENIDQSSL